MDVVLLDSSSIFLGVHLMKATWFTFSLGVALTMAICHASQAAVISLDLTDNDAAEAYAGGQNIGPLATNSSNWNVTGPDKTSGSNANGAIADLKDDTGTPTGASVTWASDGTWGNSDPSNVPGDEGKMAGGYLDHGTPVSVTFSDIPYAQYRVYGLLGSDDNPGTVTSQDWDVNGTWVFGGGSATTTPIYSTAATTFAQTGNYWSEATTSTPGNYWTIATSGTTLTITGIAATEGSLSGVIIEAIPEPATGLLAGLALAGLAFGRRRRS